jgi:hypothetical protein
MTTYPSIRIDWQHRMLSVRLSDGEIAWTDRLDDAHLVDVDAEGKAIALDIMTLDDFRIDEMAERFGFIERVPLVKAAIQSVMAPTAGSSGQAIEVHGTGLSNASASTNTESPSQPLVDTIVR